MAVLLDAGAGDTWKFAEPGTDNTYGRSEGIAVAALYMFQAGAFSSNSDQPETVDGNLWTQFLVETRLTLCF